MLVKQQELIDILCNHPNQGAKQCAMITRTQPKILVKSRADKTPSPFKQGVERLALRQVCLGASYEAAVNRQRISEAGPGTEVEYFNPLDLWGGKGIYHSRYTVQHADTGRLYFAVKPQQAQTEENSKALVIQDQWWDIATGRMLDFEADRLQDYLPLQSKNQRQDVKHDVLWRTIALDSVVELRYGQVYELYDITSGPMRKRPTSLARMNYN